MRQVFSSPRLENVERVAQMLEQAGIEVRVTHGRSYKGGLRGNFSYRDHARSGPVPAVWIVKSDDQPRGREILREAGLLDSTRDGSRYALPSFRSEEPVPRDDPARRRAFRLKLGLLLSIAVALGLTLYALGNSSSGDMSPAGSRTTAPPLPPGFAPTPDALALAALSGELPSRAGETLCLEIDGRDPTPSLLAALPDTPGRLLPASQCAYDPQARVLALGDYRPGTGTGYGKLALERRRGTQSLSLQHFNVRHDGDGWRVIAPYP